MYIHACHMRVVFTWTILESQSYTFLRSSIFLCFVFCSLRLFQSGFDGSVRYACNVPSCVPLAQHTCFVGTHTLLFSSFAVILTPLPALKSYSHVLLFVSLQYFTDTSVYHPFHQISDHTIFHTWQHQLYRLFNNMSMDGSTILLQVLLHFPHILPLVSHLLTLLTIPPVSHSPPCSLMFSLPIMSLSMASAFSYMSIYSEVTIH